MEKMRHVSVLGAGVMGTKIACILANAGFPVLLLDIINNEITEKERNLNYDDKNPIIRNKIVRTALENISEQKPSALYSTTFLKNITVGNFTDDISKIHVSDWIIEAVSEKLEIKEIVLNWIEKYRKVNSIITTNTSGISVNLLAKNKSANFQKNFFGAHFFNPPRALKLLEIIPSNYVDDQLIASFKVFAQEQLDRQCIICKDTPAFVGNRIGIFSLLNCIHLAEKFKFNVEETDYLTGLLIGKPASATFRTIDIIGIDTFINVVEYLNNELPDNIFKNYFKIPDILIAMRAKSFLGEKTNAGFYRKNTDKNAITKFSTINNNLEYQNTSISFEKDIKSIANNKNLGDRLNALLNSETNYGEFIRQHLSILFAYAAHSIPEITDDFSDVDTAMKHGFGWENGPFELWDSIGFHNGVKLLKQANLNLPNWLENIDASFTTFYTRKYTKNLLFNFRLNKYDEQLISKNYIDLKSYQDNLLFSNQAINLLDIGDNVWVCEFVSKMNAINLHTLNGINECILIAEKQNKALLIANEGKNFSVGADLLYIFNCIESNNWDALTHFINLFQQTSQNIRYSKIPVVIATQQLVLGGACEFCLHADFVQMYAETKMGLVEANVGLLPAGGGTKEYIIRAANNFHPLEIDIHTLKKFYQQIISGEVSKSAYHAIEMGLLSPHKTAISKTFSSLIYDAKNQAIKLLNGYYLPPNKSQNVKILGKTALANFISNNYNKKCAGFINSHQEHVYNKIAEAMCGGAVSESTMVNEEYLLKLEKKAFMSLCADADTVEKIKNVVKKSIS